MIAEGQQAGRIAYEEALRWEVAKGSGAPWDSLRQVTRDKWAQVAKKVRLSPSRDAALVSVEREFAAAVALGMICFNHTDPAVATVRVEPNLELKKYTVGGWVAGLDDGVRPLCEFCLDDWLAP